jgi:methionyl-tRNA synthetase
MVSRGLRRVPDMGRYYLTTAIDYVNNRPHLGTAYEKVAADVIARYRRMSGDDVRFVMGNDEHSQNVFRRAREMNLEPLAYCDRMEQEFRAVWRRLNISFDDFIRTTEPRHKRAVQALVQRSLDTGDVYEGEYVGWYCVSCEAFKQEKDLVNGLCPIHQTKPDWIKERNYFFRLSAYRDRLLAHYDKHPEFVQPESRRNEMLRLIEAGLEDISVSRAGQAWGIPLPFDPESVVYVWYDALINYIAAVGYGSDDASARTLFDTWWPASLHLVGKDITRFHCVVWPAMLLSAGVPLPRQVFGHGWVLTKGQKMSKSLGTSIDPLEAVERFGPDPLRLYLTKEIVFGDDGEFTWDRFEEKYNADLANNLGNLVNRVTSMAERYSGGVLRGPGGQPDANAQAVETAVNLYRTDAMEALRLQAGAAHAFSAIDVGNKIIAEGEPWKLAKAGRTEELGAILWNASEALRIGAVLLFPFMPESAVEILARLGEPANPPTLADAAWRSTGERRVANKGALWPRLETTPGVVKEINDTRREPKEPTVTEPTNTNPPAAAADNRISIDEFMKVDLRVARVIAAERVPNSKKLMKLSIDLGTEQRTVVAGIAEAYEAEALVGRHVAIVANLKPAKLMGIESNGMILAASPEGGKPMLVAFDAPPAPGTRVR